MSAERSDKRFDPTPARKQKAKREGNVARSGEVAALAAFGGAALGTAIAVPLLGSAAAGALGAPALRLDGAPLLGRLGAIVGFGLIPAGAAATGAIGAGLLQAGGLRVALPRWQFSRLAPAAGMRRMFGAEAFVGALRAVVAFAVVAAVLVPTVTEFFDRATTLGDPAAFGALTAAGSLRACWAAIVAGACFAAADYALVRRRWLRELRMSLEEFRRDQKETDGDPNARARRKTLHRTLVRGSVARTKDASFVVVNPIHIAVAIRYAPPGVPVPEILVRAADDGASTVKALARQHGIPVVENVPLARALYANGEAGRPIPGSTFVAVARVIAELLRAGVLE